VLAGLRFALAAVVVSSHLVWFVGFDNPLGGLRPFGPCPAVLGFLFVSGYSIAHSVSRRPAGFYRRRVLRIYPMYLLAIGLSLVPFALSRGRTIFCHQIQFDPPSPRNVAINVAMLQTFVGKPLGSDGVVWTLAVEVACYAAAPLLYRAGAGVSLLLAGCSAAAFAAFPRMRLAHYQELSYGLPLALLAWAWLGGFVFYRYRTHVAAAVVLVGGAAAMVSVNRVYNEAWGIATTAAAAAVVALAPTVPVPPRAIAPLAFLGDLSYPMYLVHVPACLLCWVIGVRNPALLVAFAVAVSVAALALDGVARRAVANLGARPIVLPTPA
jgi:peptidoglycan/LPS O-acetylase OafA/YrhL